MTRINRFLQIANFLGVAALAGLCVAQWHANSRAVAAADRLQQIRQDQAGKIADQQKTIAADSTEMDDLHQRLSDAQAAAKSAQEKLARLTAQCDALQQQQAQFKSTLDQWQAALAQRDQTIRKAGDEIQKLAQQRDDAIRRGNDAVAQYNRLASSAASAQGANR